MNATSLQQIITQMIKTEFTAMHFYLKATTCLTDEDARFHFGMLVDEEREHARSFFELQSELDENDFERMAAECPSDTELLNIDCDKLASFSEVEALETALLLEKELERVLLELAKPIDNGPARDIILKNIESTQGHIMLIGRDIVRIRGEQTTESVEPASRSLP